MNTMTLSRQRSIHFFLILSIISSFFVLPTPAKAGVLGNIWAALRPVTHIAGRVGGAVLGATMASAIVPPLGMIAGGIAGWLVGGAVTDYASANLTNLAVVGAGVAGALALGPGIVGVIGGFCLGGILGKIAMGLIYKADRAVTGGVLFSKMQETPVGAPMEQPTVIQPAATAPEFQMNSTGFDQKFKAAQEKYMAAYRQYTDAVKKGEQKLVLKAKNVYQAAHDEFLKLKNKLK